MTKIGFIGTGHIAAPMVRFLASRGHAVTVSERNAETAQSLKASHGVEVATNQVVLDCSQIVFLCLRPHIAADVISGLRFSADHKVVSVMAGLPLRELAEICAPARDISMTIPLGYVEQGGCPLPACPDDRVLRALFEPENPVLKVADEAAFNQHFAVCAFVPGVLDLMVTASDWLAQQTGDADQAARYTHQLLAGFLAALPRTGGASLLADERDALATPGTLSLQMTDGLRSGGAHEALIEALSAIGKRLEP
ncbi:pyrroline-5-carboxylate reductase [Roseobacter denitrificans]|uniref:Pyrroline-5-carboxylate reductase, putative n=1 Tax=Roseobacter denitrificans (strain ATCC 33942 / OCh 114) TaxID=375451 RepID=Q165G9_ROSDO|nr:NAD(P)-binding domain-containing protein [Roseobacter denitrificans]ABG32374.1 pyrroline-5-carboxylate reductase, putative [Roseobacter denitrificans OCh 114]AVL51846.1 pyrroline-5-carboxylate reductase [Roseobacter denitrificans]SFF81007.1 pyrroline-5-carboxylate reductase [Roseobacter denitrificans OCh 114]